MWGMAWEPVITAGLTGLLTLLGIVVTVRSQAIKTRSAGLNQHQDQDKKLDQLIHAQARLETKVDQNKRIAETGLADLAGQLGGVVTVTDTLFGMIVDLDKKATRSRNSVTKTLDKTLKTMEEATL